MNEVDICPLINAPNIVSFSVSPFMINKIYGCSMIFYIQPIAHIIAFSINGDRTVVENIVDGQWQQLLWKLVGTIVVGAVADNNRHSVCMIIGSHQMIATCF